VGGKAGKKIDFRDGGTKPQISLSEAADRLESHKTNINKCTKKLGIFN